MNERTYNQNPDKLRAKERLERLQPDRVVELCLNDQSIKSVLDIGTGSGLFAEEFYKRDLKVTGVDINPDMLKAAKTNVPEGDFRLAGAEELPFDDKSFDLVFMGMVFHEVDNHLKVLQEAKRTAKKAIVILEWHYREEEIGPPLNHRLKEELVIELAEKTGLVKTEIVSLGSMVLYKFFL